MVTGVVIPADENLPIFTNEFKGLTDYQTAVGGYIEAVDLMDLNASYFCNDESKLIGAPINRRATLLWWIAVPQMRHRDTISGDAVLIGRPDANGDSQSVPTELVELLFETKLYRAMYETADNPDSWNGNALRYENYFDAVNDALIKFDNWFSVTRAKVVAA